MGYKPLVSGAPTIEITHERYEELIRSELQVVQYRNWFTQIIQPGGRQVMLYPETMRGIIKTIEGIEVGIERYAEAEDR